MPVLSGYNDAYETPGWTAQNMAYPPASGTVNLGLPAGLFKLPMVGTFKSQNGKAMWGQVRIFPSVSEVVCGGVVIPLEPVQREFVNGSLPSDLALLSPSDVSDADPSSWEWTIHQSVGASRTVYTITVPYPDNPLDVTAIQNLDDLTGVEELPLTRDWTLLRDADFDREFIWDQQDGTGLADWRASLTIWDNDDVVQLVITEQDGITLGADSSISVFIDDTQIASLVNGTYHLVLIDPDNGDSTRFLQGRITIS